jgi:hypothetical protein
MWSVYYRDDLNSRDLKWPDFSTREGALAQACAIRRQTGKTLLRVLDPSGREVPVAEIDEFCRKLPPSV